MKATITFAMLGVVLVAASLVAAAAEERESEVPPKPAIEIIELGYDCEGGPNVQGKWWGLYPSKGGYELVEVTVTSEEAEESRLTGDTTILRANREGEPLCLIRGMKNARPGPIKTAFDGYLRLAAGQEHHVNDLPPHYDILYGLGNALLKGGFTVIKDYSINIRNDRDTKSIAQELLHIEEACLSSESFPAVRWIGDLDRDGRLDVLLDAEPYPNNRWILFLSSEAGDGEIVHQVAVLNILRG